MRAKISPDHPFHTVIQAAYRVFDYPTPLGTGVCESCCMDDEIVANFFNSSIEDLPWEYLRDWFFAAYDSANFPKNIWAYILPRILETLAAKDEPALGVEVVLDRFQTGNPQNWNADEWGVLDRFQRMYLARTIVSEDQSLDDTLCMFYRAGWSLEDMFEQMKAFPDKVILDCLNWNWHNRGIPINNFWRFDSNRDVLAHYTSPSLIAKILGLMTDPKSTPDTVSKAARVSGLMHANAGRRLRF